MREGWTPLRLGDLIRLEYGKALPAKQRSGTGYPVFGSAGEVGRHSEFLVNGPGIVVGRKGTAGSVTWTDEAFFPIDTTYWVRILSGALDLRFAFLLLSASRLDGVTTQTGVPGLNRENAYRLEVSLPPIEEQRRIVNLMSHVDDALRSCEALVSAEGALLDAASEALVFSPEFPLMKVGDLAEGKRGLVGGPFGSSLVGRDYVETGVPVIRGQNLQGRYVSGDFVFVSEEKSRSLHGNQATPGDVVFTQRGTLGQVSLIPDDAYPNYVVSQSQMRLTPDRSIVSADWVYHAFRTPRMVQRIKRADTSTANPHINLGILRTMDVPIPSVDMQAQVCSQLNAIEASIVAKMAESEALKSTRGALLSALLGGTHQIPSSYDEFIRDEGAA